MSNVLPNILFPELDTEVKMTSRTYQFDFEKGQFTGRFIYGLDAIKQSILKSLLTTRLKFWAYSDGYGCEINSLIGSNSTSEFIKSETERMIVEAIIYDERIQRVYGFDISMDGKGLYAVFSVETVDGMIDGIQVNYQVS